MQTVSSLRYAQVKVEGVGGKPRVSALDPRTATKVLSLDWQGDTSDRTLIDLRDNQTIVDQSFADAHGFDVGDRIRMLTQTGKRPSLEIVGEVKDNADLLGVTVVTQRTMARQLGVREDTLDLIKLAPGADAAQVQSRLKTVMEKAFPTADVLNQEELKQSQESQVNQLLGLIYALLSLAVIISLFGIANTLALSIHERTRELGMLRAVGMSRRQVRRLIRYESVITALIGAVLGLILGMIFAALMSVPLADQGFGLTYPDRPADPAPGVGRARRRSGRDRPGASGGEAGRAGGVGVRMRPLRSPLVLHSLQGLVRRALELGSGQVDPGGQLHVEVARRVECRAHARGAAVEDVAAPRPVLADEVEVVSADLDPLAVVGEAKAEHRPGDVLELEYVLLGDDLGQRAVGRLLSGHRTGANQLEAAIDPHRPRRGSGRDQLVETRQRARLVPGARRARSRRWG